MKAPTRTLLYVLGGLMVVSLFGIAMAGAHLLGYDPGRQRESELVGNAAPEISLPIVSGEGSSEGDRIALSALHGHVVLLDFWASWCGPCRRSIPILNRIHDRYGTRIDLYGVNVESRMPVASLRSAHRAFGAEFPTLQDVQGEAQGGYRVTSIPTLVLIDQRGVIRWMFSGVPQEGDIREHIDALLRSDR